MIYQPCMHGPVFDFVFFISLPVLAFPYCNGRSSQLQRCLVCTALMPRLVEGAFHVSRYASLLIALVLNLNLNLNLLFRISSSLSNKTGQKLGVYRSQMIEHRAVAFWPTLVV